jgi:hypothetical protein
VKPDVGDEDEEESDRRRSDDARSITDARAAATRSYYRMCARLQDAWKRPDPTRAAAVEGRLERERGRGAATSVHTTTWNEEPPDPVTAVTPPHRTAPNKGGAQASTNWQRTWSVSGSAPTRNFHNNSRMLGNIVSATCEDRQ